MTTVAICSSCSFYDQARRAASILEAAGFDTHTPDFDHNERTQAVTEWEKSALTRKFMGGLRRSKMLYVVAAGGYTGVSVCLEIGYAAGLRLPILASENPCEWAVTAMIGEVVPLDALADWCAANGNTLRYA